ncbi:LOW QUALITY PROTEIN: monocarboxylate transporter 5-like [Gigantopelta aegis]|uniref:LOW QUALITY PROTEIN: monocarboxylate transporter 5-like n=1 Tax=Gigantopelta aegis TaxID=1735272 RepID=UPI001B888110|nr:LOW QUALITY PROTEIN: monocarboxylate transporter 5-like [Gigantopelta aegis]
MRTNKTEVTVEEDRDLDILPDSEPDPEPDLEPDREPDREPDLGETGQTKIRRSDEEVSAFRRGRTQEQGLGSVESERPEKDSQKETVVVEDVVVVDDDDDDDDEGDEVEDDDDGVPIDRGWAWMTVLAYFFNLFISVGYVKALGVLFVEFLAIYRASVTMTTLLMGTMSATYSVASFLTMQVVLTHLDTRKTIILGGIMTSAGITLSYFADSMVFLICMQGVVVGIEHALINGPGMILVNEYFNKRRGIATAIAICGVSVGGSVFPPFVNYLFGKFTLRDTFLILGAISLNILVGGMLSRPVSFYKKSHARKKLLLEDKPAESSHSRENILLGDKTDESSHGRQRFLLGDKTGELLRYVSKTERKPSKEINVIENYSHKTSCLLTKSHDHLPADKFQTLPPLRQRTYSDSMTYRTRTWKNQETFSRPTLLLLSNASEIGPVSLTDITWWQRTLYVPTNIDHDVSTVQGISLMNGEHNVCMDPSISLMDGHHDGIMQETSKPIITEHISFSICQRILRLMKKPFTSFDFSIFQNPLFSMLVCAAVFTIQTQAHLTYILALAIEHGISPSNAALLLTVTASLDLLSKLAFGWFADLGVIRKHYLQMTGLCISATSSLFVSLYSSFPLMMGYAVIQGIFSGVYRSLYVLVLIDFVGTENMGKAFGIIQLIHGSMVAIAHSVIGSLRDLTGSYSASFQYTAACGFVGSSILLLERWATRKKNQIRNTSISKPIYETPCEKTDWPDKH